MARAFLFGAGVSKAEYKDAPLSNDFLSLLRKKNRDLFDNIDDAVKHYSEVDTINYNIEDLMILATEKLPEQNRPVFMSALHRAIYELLAESTHSDKKYMHDFLYGDINPSPRITLINTLLNNNNLKPDDFFMTLNYDLYLDREILLFQNKIDYGLSARFTNYIDDGIHVKDDKILSVYHLHGALNWRMIDNNRLNIGLGAFPPKKKDDLCLVPPGKKDLNPILTTIWETSRNRLELADELIIIGCSLNPRDIELIEMIKKFKEKKGASKIKYIYYPGTSRSINRNSVPLGFHKVQSKSEEIDTSKFNLYRYGFSLHAKTESEELNKERRVIDFIFNSASA